MVAPVSCIRPLARSSICRQCSSSLRTYGRKQSFRSIMVYSTQTAARYTKPSSSPLPFHIRSQRTTSRPIKSHNYYTSTQSVQPVFTPTQTTILQASLTHVAEHGFTNDALLLGIEDSGYLPVTTNLFPRGAVDLIFYHMISARQALAGAFPLDEATFHNSPPSKTTIQERTVAIVLHRLQANAPYNQHIPSAMAQLAQPTYVPAAVADLAELADEVVYLSGETALDTSWYTRRASIAAVYAATELFMTQDTSPGFQETEGFLRRRLEGLDRAAWALGSVTEWVGFTAGSAVNLMRNWGVRL